MDLLPLVLMLVIPWAATFLGSLLAAYIDTGGKIKSSVLLGFAAGVMFASTVWSLLIPAFDYAGTSYRGILYVTLGFISGCLLMLGLDKILPHQHSDDTEAEGIKTKLPRQILLVLAVALHNIPEGMALGVILSATLQPGFMSITLALSFAVGLALQNFPEGMAVVLPLRETGLSRKKIIAWGAIASFAEPLAAIMGMFLSYRLTQSDNTLMPILLGCAAGAMAFIIVEELIPESQSDKNSHLPTYGFLVGFWIMAVMGAASA